MIENLLVDKIVGLRQLLLQDKKGILMMKGNQQREPVAYMSVQVPRRGEICEIIELTNPH